MSSEIRYAVVCSSNMNRLVLLFDFFTEFLNIELSRIDILIKVLFINFPFCFLICLQTVTFLDSDFWSWTQPPAPSFIKKCI